MKIEAIHEKRKLVRSIRGARKRETGPGTPRRRLSKDGDCLGSSMCYGNNKCGVKI